MKDKIFNKLKQAYSSLGLGDSILLGHSDALANTGLVTEENVDAVVTAQKSFLEGLQKSNDKRVADALAKAKAEAESKAKAEAEADAKAKAEAEAKAKEAEAERMQKAIENALNAEREKAAKAKAEAEKAEAEKKAQEELEKKKAAQEVPEWWKPREEEFAKKEEAARQKEDAFLSSIKELREMLEKQSESYSESSSKLTKTLAEQKQIIDSLNKENQDMKLAKAKAERQNLIVSKAKELGIPQYRIDEGFTISDDATEDVIESKLSVIANNIKVNQAPASKSLFNNESKEVSKETASEIAKSLVP